MSNRENVPMKAAQAASSDPQYEKMTLHEQILHRPDTYLGNVVPTDPTPQWIMTSISPPVVEYRKISIVPGFLQLFEEVLANAADNKQRDDPTIENKAGIMSSLDVVIDPEAGSISVSNDGRTITTKKHHKEPMHTPQLIFGNLLTSSNYKDNENRYTCGRNGYGAKLTNIFSRRFVVRIDNSAEGKSYTQEWRDNMTVVDAPKITEYSGKANRTRVTFWPDFKHFSMAGGIDDASLGMLHRRVFDVAGTTPKSLKVSLNGVVLPVRDFESYVSLYVGDRVHAQAKLDPRFEVCVALSDPSLTGGKAVPHMSFVNNVVTTKGTHVSLVEDLVLAGIVELIGKTKGAGKSVKELAEKDVRPHVNLFLNALVVNPTFGAQNKTVLTTSRANLYKSIDNTKQEIKMTEQMMKKIKESGLVELIIERATAKQVKKLTKTDGKKSIRRLTGIPKLEDANLAGTGRGHECTLILTEGDSAKALAVSGLSVVGRDRYGVFPLKGKLLNVREASVSQQMGNSEITALKQILGLASGKHYDSTRELRYGRVMIMADQDHDGSHIKGLVMNFFEQCWPSLLQLQGTPFLWEFITPIVKVSRGISAAGVASAKAKEFLFYSLQDYEHWKSTTPQGEAKGWTIKYYKGLGTSTAADAKAYFSDLHRHQIAFAWDAQSSASLKLAFDAKLANQRKEWLARYDPHTAVGVDQSGCGQSISYTDFMQKEFIKFSLASNERAIPSVVDGLKPGQRKALFAAFKRNLVREVKVAQFVGYISEHTAYHHGEASLCSTIVGMAQNFVGNNNLNLFLPNGQFGTRLQGGKDAASPRYIFTTLNPVTRFAFSPEDDALLSYLTDDGLSVEPEWYVPVVPMVLINGSAGIGTGWSSEVPNYSPRDIVSQLRSMISIARQLGASEELTPGAPLDGRLEAAFISSLPELQPWYKGFAGVIKMKSPDRFVVKGVLERLGADKLHISELPLHCWTGEYKSHLESLLAAGEIREFKEHHTDSSVSFEIEMDPSILAANDAAALYKKFKLNSSLATSNMVLFTRDGTLKKYESANDILREFYAVRMEFYHKRKAALLAVHRAEQAKLSNKARFIRAYLGLSNEKILINNVPEREIIAQLDRGKYLRIPKKVAAKGKASPEDEADEDASSVGEEEAVATKSGQILRNSDFDYLLNIPLKSLSREQAAKLMSELAASEAALREIEGTNPSDMWLRDLEAFSQALDAQESLEKKLAEEAAEKSRAKRLKAEKSGSSSGSGAKVSAPVLRGEVIIDVSDDFDETKVKVPRKKKTADSTTATAGLSAVDAIMAAAADDDDDVVAEVAAPRKTKKLAPTASAAAAPSRKPSVAAAAAGKKVPKKSAAAASSEDDDEDVSMADSDAEDAAPVAPRARPGRAAAAKAVYVDKSDDDEDDEDDEDEDVSEQDEDEDDEDAPAPVAAAKKKAAAPAAVAKKAPAARKKKPASSDDDDEGDDESDFSDAFDEDESDFELSGKKKGKKQAAAAPKSKPAPAPAAAKKLALAPAPAAAVAKKAAAKPAAAAPKKKKASRKAASSDDDEEEDDEQSESEQDDDDDFESKPAPKKKAPAAAKKPVAVAEKAAPAPKVTKKVAAAAAAPIPALAPAVPVKESSEMSLMERMAARLASVDLASASAAAAAAGPKKSAPVGPSTPPKKKAAAKREKEVSTQAQQLLQASPTSPDPKRRRLYNAVEKGKKMMDLIPATPQFDAGEGAATKAKSKTKAVAPAAKVAKPAAAAKKGGKKAIALSDDDDEGEAEYAPVAASSRPQRAAKPTKSYVDKSEDEEEEEDEDDVSVEEISDDDYED